ncbi:hypothetical protein [Enterococcus cecorum]|uniref:hypothetical protein n=1 Tax=Enterococcus cecorum TaxID=44008 RepID=UPI001FABA59E|nr:hypothetical protein [Enterococcus cecorum]MCJ0537648.1 hypothetical protein [Enterococcus cecorum]MCJ0545536.1 hypothetical protein [Enterococcus cecorum]MCJ0549887.1 hypothetical protein [Enterococcus cecorum]MCJ0568915.1 hypothetical protein [Enterococcus cecorum]
MKKIALLGIVCSLFIISGCGNEKLNNKSEDITSTQKELLEETFVEDFKNGLQSSWEYMNNTEVNDAKEYYRTALEKEYEYIEKYNSNFEPEGVMHEVICLYINIVFKMHNLDKDEYTNYYHNIDMEKNIYSKLNMYKLILANDIIQTYKIEFDNEYITNKQSFMSDVELVKNNSTAPEIDKAIQTYQELHDAKEKAFQETGNENVKAYTVEEFKRIQNTFNVIMEQLYASESYKIRNNDYEEIEEKFQVLFEKKSDHVFNDFIKANKAYNEIY